MDELRHLALDQRNQHEDQANEQQQNGDDDEKRAQCARHPAPLAPGDGRVAEVGEDRTDEKWRNDSAEECEQQRKNEHRDGDP